MFDRLYGRRATLRALTGLDFGLRVRVYGHSSQRVMYSSSENLSARQRICELAEEISGLRVYKLLDARPVGSGEARQWGMRGFSPLGLPSDASGA